MLKSVTGWRIQKKTPTFVLTLIIGRKTNEERKKSLY